jgi:hypothetical protein
LPFVQHPALMMHVPPQHWRALVQPSLSSVQQKLSGMHVLPQHFWPHGQSPLAAQNGSQTPPLQRFPVGQPETPLVQQPLLLMHSPPQQRRPLVQPDEPSVQQKLSGMHWLPQHCCPPGQLTPGGHGRWQMPPLHCCPSGQPSSPLVQQPLLIMHVPPQHWRALVQPGEPSVQQKLSGMHWSPQHF